MVGQQVSWIDDGEIRKVFIKRVSHIQGQPNINLTTGMNRERKVLAVTKIKSMFRRLIQYQRQSRIIHASATAAERFSLVKGRGELTNKKHQTDLPLVGRCAWRYMPKLIHE